MVKYQKKDYSYLYKITGYIKTDTDRTSKFYLGLVDKDTDSLSDNGVKTSIKGIYMVNYQNMDDNDVYFVGQDIADAYNNVTKINLYASMFQFDTQNHAWKVFIVDDSIENA